MWIFTPSPISTWKPARLCSRVQEGKLRVAELVKGAFERAVAKGDPGMRNPDGSRRGTGEHAPQIQSPGTSAQDPAPGRQGAGRKPVPAALYSR